MNYNPVICVKCWSYSIFLQLKLSYDKYRNVLCCAILPLVSVGPETMITIAKIIRAQRSETRRSSIATRGGVSWIQLSNLQTTSCLLAYHYHAMIDFVSKVFRIIRVTPQSWKMLIRGHKLRYLWPLEFLSASRFLNLDLDSRMRRTIPSYKKLKGEHQ